MSNRADGLLAIWSDVNAEVEMDYRHWFSREHVPERVGVDGFLAGRVFQHVNADWRRYFFVYELSSPDVMAGTSYLARLNAPTPWSQRVMPMLQNFARGGGRVVARAGMGQGGVVSPLRLDLAATPMLSDPDACDALVHRLVGLDGIASAWLMKVDIQATTLQTKEKQMRRSTEHAFDAVLCIEGVAVQQVQEAARSALLHELQSVPVEDVPAFTLCYALNTKPVSAET